MIIILETKTKQAKNPNTKTTYYNTEVKNSLLSEREYNLTTNEDTLKWFRNLGGSESAQRGYTCFGYVIYKLISASPDRQNKTIREYKFISFDYEEGKIYKNLFKSYSNGLFMLKRFKDGKTLQELKAIIKSKRK